MSEFRAEPYSVRQLRLMQLSMYTPPGAPPTEQYLRHHHVSDTDPFLIAVGKLADIATLTAAHDLLDMPQQQQRIQSGCSG
jgi:hypothetical protein